MNKSYLIIPLVAVVAFGGVYWSYSSRREALDRQFQEQAASERRALMEKEQRDRAEAAASANAALAVRQQEKRDKDQREAAQKQVQAEAEQRRDHAFEQERKLRSQIDRRRVEIERVTERLTLLAARRRELAEESAFLQGYLPQTETNRESLYRLLEKWETAERARAAATAAPSAASPKPNHTQS